MTQERYPPDDPRAWLARARSDLAIATSRVEGACFEDLCFHAQQAAEKAFKAVLLHNGARIPRIHDLAELINRLDNSGVVVPSEAREGVRLTHYAVEARYPGVDEPLSEEDWAEARQLAERVVDWANSAITPPNETASSGESANDQPES